MRFHAAISDADDSSVAAADVVETLRKGMGGSAEAVFLFFTQHHADSAGALAERVMSELGAACVVGCSAEGVIGGDREIERSPGLAALAARGRGMRFHPYYIAKDEWQEMVAEEGALLERVAFGTQTRGLVGFGDPFSTPIRELLSRVDESMPNVPLLGGMASAGRAPGQNVLVMNEEIYDEGFVGVSLHGEVEVRTVVSQGCRPIGQPMVITRGKANVVEQLGGKSAMEALQQTVQGIAESERELLGNGLFIGRAISEYREQFARGDFLVRSVMGLDREKGALLMTDLVRVGQTVQFHVRDAATATEDLTLMLEEQGKLTPPPAGGLLFSCNGRGRRMFEVECHDVSHARGALPETPIAGFFAAGELGPVGGKNFIHGHTASFALFRQTGKS